MPPFEVPKEAEPYVAELKLAGRIGIESWVPPAESVLIELVAPGVGNPRESAKILRSRVADVLSRMSPEKETIGHVLLGFGKYAAWSMFDRNKRAAELLLQKRNATWDRVRREPREKFFLSIYQELEQMTFDAANGVPPADIVAPHGYELLKYVSEYNIETGTAYQRRVVRAVRDNVDRWELASFATGRPMQQIELVGPGSLRQTNVGKVRAKNPGFAFNLSVEFPQPLSAGQEFEFTLIRTAAVDLDKAVAEGWIEERHLTPSVTIHSAEIAIRLPYGRVPSRVWAFEHRAPWLVPGVPTSDVTPTLEPGGRIALSWQNPPVGRACGIAWEW